MASFQRSGGVFQVLLQIIRISGDGGDAVAERTFSSIGERFHSGFLIRLQAVFVKANGRSLLQCRIILQGRMVVANRPLVIIRLLRWRDSCFFFDKDH